MGEKRRATFLSIQKIRKIHNFLQEYFQEFYLSCFHHTNHLHINLIYHDLLREASHSIGLKLLKWEGRGWICTCWLVFKMYSRERTFTITFKLLTWMEGFWPWWMKLSLDDISNIYHISCCTNQILFPKLSYQFIESMSIISLPPRTAAGLSFFSLLGSNYLQFPIIAKPLTLLMFREDFV